MQATSTMLSKAGQCWYSSDQPEERDMDQNVWNSNSAMHTGWLIAAVWHQWLFSALFQLKFVWKLIQKKVRCRVPRSLYADFHLEGVYPEADVLTSFCVLLFKRKRNGKQQAHLVGFLTCSMAMRKSSTWKFWMVHAAIESMNSQCNRSTEFVFTTPWSCHKISAATTRHCCSTQKESCLSVFPNCMVTASAPLLHHRYKLIALLCMADDKVFCFFHRQVTVSMMLLPWRRLRSVSPWALELLLPNLRLISFTQRLGDWNKEMKEGDDLDVTFCWNRGTITEQREYQIESRGMGGGGGQGGYGRAGERWLAVMNRLDKNSGWKSRRRVEKVPKLL